MINEISSTSCCLIDYPYYQFQPQPYGWICPRCRQVHAPSVLQCWCHDYNNTIVICNEDPLDDDGCVIVQ